MNLLSLSLVFLLLPFIILLILLTVYQANIMRKFIHNSEDEYKLLKHSLQEISGKIELQQKLLNNLSIKNDHLEKRLNSKESIDLITKKTAQSIDEVTSLYKQGYEVKTIASKLHRGNQEIELILKRFSEDRSNWK